MSRSKKRSAPSKDSTEKRNSLAYWRYRRKRVIALRDQGWKFREIGELFGFTRQRAWELYRVGIAKETGDE